MVHFQQPFSWNSQEMYTSVATCNLNQWALDFKGNLARTLVSIQSAKVNALGVCERLQSLPHRVATLLAHAHRTLGRATASDQSWS